MDCAGLVSNASVKKHSVYDSMEQCRPSGHGVACYAQNEYQNPPSAPLFQPVSNNCRSHQSFGGSSATQHRTLAMPPSMPQPPQVYPSNGSSYQYLHGSHVRQTSNSQNYTQPANPAHQQTQYHIGWGYEDSSDYKVYRQPSLTLNDPVHHSHASNLHPTVDGRPLYGMQNYYS